MCCRDGEREFYVLIKKWLCLTCIMRKIELILSENGNFLCIMFSMFSKERFVCVVEIESAIYSVGLRVCMDTFKMKADFSVRAVV